MKLYFVDNIENIVRDRAESHRPLETTHCVSPIEGSRERHVLRRNDDRALLRVFYPTRRHITTEERLDARIVKMPKIG